MATLFSAERDCDYDKDCISELPDDILLTFVSPLGMKEAANTSIISKRWRYLWTKRTHLDFNHLIILPESEPDAGNAYFFTAAHKDEYIKWVNQVVDLHSGPCIDTFRVSFRFDSCDSHHIDKWVKFALLKKVQNLELRLFNHKAVYTIEFDNLKPSLGIGDSGISFLKSLHLNSINVSGDFLEYLLARCCLLERLYVEYSQTLVRVKVVGLSCKLKQLTIRRCRNLEELEIDAVNLTYFEYFSVHRFSDVVFKSMSNLSMLDEAKFGFFPSIFQQISPVAAQISKLSLDLKSGTIPAVVLPTFCNLKQLTMQVNCEAGYDIVGVRHFLMACPLLREFNVEISFRSLFDDDDIEEAFELQKVDMSRDDVHVETKFDWEYFERVLGIYVERSNHPNLKLLQVVGFFGSDPDVDLILFLVLLASNLEAITCDSRSLYKRPQEKAIEASRNRAAKLRKLIPPNVALVII